jgi:acetyl esterase/lipase
VPLVAYVHGGAFRVGDKRNRITDKVALFTGAGWAFASLNYRLVDRPGAGPTNGVYPAAEEDVAAGIAHLVDRAREYGLDRSQVMLLGHSAGAHLVALVSTDGSFLEREGLGLDDIACTVPLDTTYDIPAQIAGGGVVAAMYATAFGDDRSVWVRGSPNRNVAPGKDIPAFQIVTRGQPERIAEAEAFGAVLTDAGVDAEVRDVSPLSHAAVNDAVRAGDPTVGEPLMAFLRECVGSR